MEKFSKYILISYFLFGTVNNLICQDTAYYDTIDLEHITRVRRIFVEPDDQVIFIENEERKLLKFVLWNVNRVSGTIVPINDSLAESFSHLLYGGALDSKGRLKLQNGDYVREGPKYSFNEDGSISQRYTYKNDKVHGIYIAYFKNGLVEIKGAYKNGNKTGIWLYYNEQGKLIKKVNHGN